MSQSQIVNGNPVARLHLSVLTDLDTDQPRSATDPEPLAPPIATHHRRVGRERRHLPEAERAAPTSEGRCRRGRARRSCPVIAPHPQQIPGLLSADPRNVRLRMGKERATVAIGNLRPTDTRRMGRHIFPTASAELTPGWLAKLHLQVLAQSATHDWSGLRSCRESSSALLSPRS